RRHRAVGSDSRRARDPGRGQPDRRRPDGPRPGAVPAGGSSSGARTPPRARRCPARSLRRAPRPREERGPDPPRVRARRLDGVGGLPAVAGGAPGGEEVVGDGETGVLTKGDPMALGDAVIGLLLDAERRAVMSLRARQTAERLFDVRLMIERTLAVYAAATARVTHPVP